MANKKSDDKDEPKMVSVKLRKACKLTRNDGITVSYDVGEHEMPEEDANHWFLRSHTDDPPVFIPQPGTPQAGILASKEAARRNLYNIAMEQQMMDASDKVREENLKTMREEEANRKHEPMPIELPGGPSDELEHRQAKVAIAEDHSTMMQAAQRVAAAPVAPPAPGAEQAKDAPAGEGHGPKDTPKAAESAKREEPMKDTPKAAVVEKHEGPKDTVGPVAPKATPPSAAQAQAAGTPVAPGTTPAGAPTPPKAPEPPKAA